MPQRHNAYTRLNPSGHKELVIKKKGKRDTETLNELVESLLEMLEGIDYAGPLPTGGGAGSPEQLEYQRNPNQPDAPLMVGSRGDVDIANGESPNNMTASEPRAADGPERSRAKSKLGATFRGTPPRDKYITGYRGDNIDYGATHSESFTGTAALGIVPGYGAVHNSKPKSKKRKTKDKNKTTKSESVMSSKRVINEWDPAFQGAGYEPGDNKMPSPKGSGVAKRTPKKDTVGKYDTTTKNMGKEWPRQHNETPAMCDVDENGVENDPQGVHVSEVGEPDDGHQTKVNHDWPAKAKNSGSGVAEPVSGNRYSDGGELTGGTAPKGLSTGMESWSPELFGQMIGEDYDLQSLFDAYARDKQMVCLEDFQMLCNSHGMDIHLDEASLLHLMRENDEYIFYEGVDANGPYWTPTPFAKQGIQEGHQRPFDVVNEVQIRSPEEEVAQGMPEIEVDVDIEEPDAPPPGPGHYGMHNTPWDEDPDTGNIGSEDELGVDDEEDIYGQGRELWWTPEDVDEEDDYFSGFDDWEFDEDEFSETWQESVKRFFKSAHNIIERNAGANRKAIGEALNRSWNHYVKGLDARRTPGKIKSSLQEMAKRFPTFRPIAESDAMDKLGGNSICDGGDGPADEKMLAPADQPGPDDMNDHGDALGKKQKNTADSTPVIKGTEKGLKENVQLLTKYVRRQIKEGASSLRGKFDVTFSCLVQEGDQLNRTDNRKQLAEAIADVEELLQFHHSDNVVLEANFHNGSRKTILVHRIPMLQIAKRPPIVAEGAALFRFARHAELFAERMMSEGHTCRLAGHNWGAAVKVLSEKKWIQNAINPEHEGYCTPMSKSTCTPKRKALAKRFKKGGDLYSGKGE